MGLTKAYLLIGALGCLLILLLPALLSKRYDVFQPLSFAILSVAIGVTGRTIYILSDPNGAEHLLLSKDPEFLLPAILATLVGLLFFVIGYVQKLPKLPVQRLKITRSDEWDVRRLWFVVLLFTGISLIATMLFLQRTGFSFQDIANISRKRFVVLKGSEIGYTALGYLRWAASLSQVAFMLMMAYFVSSGKRWLSAMGLVTIAMFVIAAVFPFLTSARGPLIWLVLSSMIMWHYLRRPLSTNIVIIAAIMAVVVLSVMLNLRCRGFLDIGEVFSLKGVVETLFGSRDFLDITTTAHIIAAIQDGRLDYAYGRTYFTWLYAPIPRTMWPEKPVVSIGWEIKRCVFGLYGLGGIPPGSIGEAYWNFGYAGVVVMWLLGAVIGWVYRSLRDYVSQNKNIALIYVYIFLLWAFRAFSNSSSAIVDALQTALPLILALYFVTWRSKLSGVKSQ
ncbi:MAG: hypothetical protein DRN91_04545 [Candidatus Alkanophagales archaeon]|nr:MAG: hypothetical protein DRN91_04545 [Candidatus Alkanophagales archaeon]